MWDSGDGYDRVRMNQSIIDGCIHYLSTNKIQHISADHQDNRFRQSYNCAPVEFRFRHQFESSFAEDATHTLLVAARHQQALFGLVGRGIDEVQEAPLMSSVLTIAHHTLHRPGKTSVPPGQPEYLAGDRRDK